MDNRGTPESRLAAWWAQSDRDQRASTVGGLIFLVVVVGGLVWITTDPSMWHIADVLFGTI